MSRTATILGKVSVTPKGAWNGANSYNFLDIVSNAGSSYLAVQPVAAGTPLDNTSYWLQISAKGDPGQDGTDGAAGEITGASASISGGVGTPGVTVTPGGTPTARTFAFVFTNLKGEQGETGNGIASIVKTGTAGLVDTYTITYTDGTTATYEVKNGAEALDATLTLEGYAADAKAVGEALALKQNAADPAGLADNLTPYSADSGATQTIPFINQGTGCGNGESVVDTGSYAQLKKKLGNTVTVNQLANPSNTSGTIVGVSYSITNGKLTASGTVSATNNIVLNPYNVNGLGLAGHKIYLPPVGGGAKAVLLNNIGGRINLTDGGIIDIPDTDTRGYAIRLENGNTINVTNYACQFIDLTLWFGSNDRIPAHLLSHPEDFGRYYSGSLAYNPGQLVNADGSVLTSIGRNLFDKSTAVANERWKASGTEYASGNTRSDYIPCIPNTTYYFKDIQSTTTLGSGIYWFDADKNYISAVALNITSGTATAPSNARYVGINLPSTSLDTCCVSLYYSGESGYSDYYPYTVLAEVDTGSEVLRGAGAVADEKTPDGTITRKIGVVDLGSLTWSASSSNAEGYNRFISVETVGVNTPTGAQGNVRCAKYIAITGNDAYSRITGVTLSSGGKVVIYDETLAQGTAAAFKTAMSGVYLLYELATPTTEQGTPFSGASADNFAIDDFGSMYWAQTNGVPQGVEIFYPYDYKAAVDTILNEVNGDVTKLVTAEKVPDAPSSNGTYVLKVTVSGGTPTYSWVAE